LTARIAYVDFDGNRAISAALNLDHKDEIDEAFLHTHCGEMLKAVDLICEWVKN
jgi:aspartate aminotransferase